MDPQDLKSLSIEELEAEAGEWRRVAHLIGTRLAAGKVHEEHETLTREQLRTLRKRLQALDEEIKERSRA